MSSFLFLASFTLAQKPNYLPTDYQKLCHTCLEANRVMCKLGGYTHLTESSSNNYPSYNSETQNPQDEVYSGFGDQYYANIAADLAAD